MELELFQRIALFADLSPGEQKSIAARLRLQHYEEGSFVFNRGGESNALYIIKSGWVQLIADVGQAVLATLAPGNILGEADCFLGRTHTVAARVTTDTEVWTLYNDDLRALIAADPELGLNLSLAFGANLVQFERYLVEERLRKVPFFSRLSEEELLAIAGYLQARRFAPGDIIFSAGDEPNGLYLIENGLVRLIASEPDGNFSELREGDAFGEMAVLSGKKYTATARAAEESVLWLLPPSDFEKLTTAHPSIRQTLSRVLRERLSSEDQEIARQQLKSIPLFEALSPEALAALAEALLLCHIPANQVVFAQGDPGDALYLIEQGQVEVSASSRSTGDAACAVLGKGDFLGEMALLTGKTRTGTARALTNSNLWVLYRTDFDALIIRHPTISLALTQALRSRLSQAEQQFVQRHLKKISLLAELSTAELKEIADRLRPEKYRRGDVILVEGNIGNVVCFIEEGQVELLSRLGNAYIVLDRLSEGDFFGDTAILGGQYQTATVRAVTELSLWVLDQRGLEELVAKYPRLIIALSRISGERLNRTLMQLKEASRALPAPGHTPAQLVGGYAQQATSPVYEGYQAMHNPAAEQAARVQPTTPPAAAPQPQPVTSPGFVAGQTVRMQPNTPPATAPQPQPNTPPGFVAGQTVRMQPTVPPAAAPQPQPAADQTMRMPAATPPAAASQSRPAADQTMRMPAAARPAAAPQPARAGNKPDPTLIFPHRQQAATAQQTTTTPPQSAPAKAAAPAAGQKSGKAKPAPKKGIKSAGSALENSATWFASLSMGAKLRLAVIILLFIWICGISAPLAIISLLGGLDLNSIVPIGSIQSPDAAPPTANAPLDTQDGLASYPAAVSDGPENAGSYFCYLAENGAKSAGSTRFPEQHHTREVQHLVGEPKGLS